MKLSYAWMIGCAGTALLLAGCGPKIAETPLGAEDQQWQQTIQASYPGWQPPRVAAPAVKGNLDENFVNPAAPAADSGEPVVESAEPAVSAAAVETTGVPAASADAEVVVVAPAEETKAPEAAPAAEAKAETAKAAPAAEAKAETAEAAEAAEAAPAEKYEEYVVVKGDSLSKIAKKFYKDGNRFPVLIKANEDLLKGNPNRLRVGMKLRIPAL